MSGAGYVALALALGVLGAGRVAAARGCSEHSAIVGRQHCSSYGAQWTTANQMPAFWGDLSFATHVVPLQGAVFTSGTPPAAGSYSLRGEQLMRASAVLVGASTRGALAIGSCFYVGYDFAVAFGGLPGTEIFTDGLSTVVPSGLTYFAAGALVGAAVTRGRFTGRLEVEAGARNIAVSTTQFFREQNTTSEADVFQAVFEPRAQIEYWLGSGITLGVWAGAEISPGSGVGVVSGLSIAGHTRTFDGTRGP